jgi:hypothetical protein
MIVGEDARSLPKAVAAAWKVHWFLGDPPHDILGVWLL